MPLPKMTATPFFIKEDQMIAYRNIGSEIARVSFAMLAFFLAVFVFTAMNVAQESCCYSKCAQKPNEKPCLGDDYYVESPDIITISRSKPTDKKDVIVKEYAEDFVLRENMSVIFETVNEYGGVESSQKLRIDGSGILDLREILKKKTARIVIGDLTIKEAEEHIQNYNMPLYGKRYKLTVLKMDAGELFGNHLARPDGFITFGTQRVYVNGLTTKEIAHAIELSCPNLEKDTISVSVFAYNSKAYYVIFRSETDDRIAAFPYTEKTTFRSALKAVADMKDEPFQIPKDAKVYIARPVANDNKPEILSVDLIAITEKNNDDANYKIYPGDRIFITTVRN